MSRINQYLVNFLNSLQGLRKTIVMLGLIVIATLFRVKGYISGGDMVSLLQSTVIAFFASNGIEHLTNTVKEYVNSKGQKEEEDVVSLSSKDEG